MNATYALITGLVAAILVLLVVVALLADQIIRLMSQASEDDKADHAKCVAHIADITSGRIVALALRDLAHRYDTVEGKRELRRMAARHDLDGPTLPALWLLRRADELDPPEEVETGLRTLDGRRVR